MLKKERNYGIDLLRIVSMYMVMILHLLNHGQILKSKSFFTIEMQGTGLLYFFCIIAVNVFALISGYVGIESRHKSSRIIELWLEVVLFSIISIIITMLFGFDVKVNEIIRSLFPTFFGNYWYFNSYLILFIFMPFLSLFLKCLTKKKFQKLICVLIILTSVIGYIARWDVFAINSGFSSIWLTVMFIYGAYFKLYGSTFNFKKRKLFFIYLIGTLITFIFTNLFTALQADSEYFLYLFTGYNWPCTVISSLVVFLIFIQLKFKNKKTIRFINITAKFSFGGYLLQDNILIRSNFMNFAWISNYNIIVMIVLILLIAFLWLLLGILLDKCIQLIIRNLNLVEYFDKFFNFVAKKIFVSLGYFAHFLSEKD